MLRLSKSKTDDSSSPTGHRAWFRALSDVAFEGMLLFEGEVLVDVNQRAVELFGYGQRSELVGRSPAELVAPVSEREFRESLAGNRADAYRVLAQRKDGTTFTAEARSRQAAQSERPTQVVALRDVTAHALADGALRASERQFRALFNSSFQFMSLLEPNGVVVEVNQTSLDFFGLRREQVVDGLIWEVMVELMQPQQRQELQRMVKQAGGGDFAREELQAHVDGEVVYVDVSMKPIFDENGFVTRIVAEGRDVTEHRLAEAATQASAERLQALTESAVDAIVTADHQGFITDWNRGARAIFGYDRSEVAGKTLEMLMPARYVEAHRKGMERVRRTGKTRLVGHTVGVHGLRKGGDEFPLELSLSWWRAGGEVFFTGIMRDVTERKQAEEQLHRQNALVLLLQEVAAKSNEAVTVEEAFQFAVDRICAFTGWPVGHVYLPVAAESTLLVPTDIWHLDDAERFAAFRALTMTVSFAPEEGLPGKVFATGAPDWIVDVKVDPDFPRAKLAEDIGVRAGFAFPVLQGREVVAVLEFFSAEAAEPNAALLEVMAHIGAQLGRVVERKRAEEELRHSEERLSQAQAIAHLGSWEWNVQTGELFWSDELYRIYGFEPDGEITYERYLEGLHPEDRERVSALIRVALETRAPLDFHHRIVRPDGEVRILHGEGVVLTDEEGAVRTLVGTAQDVTAQREAEEALERTNAELRRRNRELQEFAYIASHDLQEPLRKITSFGDLLKNEYADQLDEEAMFYIGRMEVAATRMSILIRDLLDFSRITTLEDPFQEVDLNQIAREVCSDLEVSIAEAGVRVEIEPLPVVEADPSQMRQLLQNLIGNAVKYRRSGGRPWVKVRGHVEEDRQQNKRRCLLEVEDNGVGFEEKYMEKLFMPFQRLHRDEEYEGTGIGLAICRRIVERHGGTITAHSKPGRGSRFVVTLPMQ